MLAKLLNLSLSSYSDEAKGMVDWILNDPPPPNKTIPRSVLEFCEKVVDALADKAVQTVPDNAKNIKESLNGACPAALNVASATPTRCSCKTNKLCSGLSNTFIQILPSIPAGRLWVSLLGPGSYFMEHCNSRCDDLPMSTLPEP